MTIPATPDQWDLARLRQIVTQHDLESTRIEYKRELGNGNSTLEAIAALANTFGGAVLVGVNEDEEGADRLVGVDAGDRDRLSRMCWDRLVPPFSPDITAIKLDTSNKYVLAVLINPDQARRPIMLTPANKILVRLAGHNVPADWYRLRELFAEQQASATPAAMPPSGNFIPTPDLPHADLGIRNRLLLTGPRGKPHYINESARDAVLGALNSGDLPATGIASTLVAMMSTWARGPWNSRKWMLRGRSSTHTFNANWHGFLTTGQVLTEVRLTTELTPSPPGADILLLTLETILTNPRRAVADRQAREQNLGTSEQDATAFLMELAPTPFVSLDGIRRLMHDSLASLWGMIGSCASTGIFGQPLGPPALLDCTIFTIAATVPSRIPLSDCIDFGAAYLIPENQPSPWTQLNPIQADHQLLDPAEQGRAIYDWLARFGIYNGYQNIEQELMRHG